MDKRIYLILFLSLVIFMSGCKNKGDDIATILTKDIFKGSDGLVMSFLDNAPASEVYEKSYATVGLRLQNKGTYDIEEGYLAISLEKDYMESVTSSLKATARNIDFSDYDHITFNLMGKSVEAPNGDEDVLTFIMKIWELEQLSQTHTSTIAITSCYKYKTVATETVCIDSDIYGMKQRVKGCTVKEISLGDQGAPVAVTKIQPKMLPEEDGVEPQFIITIENKGGGLVVDKDSVEDACYSEALDYTKLNNVEVSAYLMERGGRTRLDCNIDEDEEIGKVMLKEKRATVRCKLPQGIEEEGTYSTPLTIEIDYGYSSTISQDIKIRKVVI